MNLAETEAYRARGLSPADIERLSLLGDLLLASRTNVTSVCDPRAIEHQHFLDSLALLEIEGFRRHPLSIVDVGSGGGFPALVLAIALPRAAVTALESVKKKCAFIAEAAARLGLENLHIACERAEEAGRGNKRETFDIAVVRAVGSLDVIAEYSVPLIRVGGLLVVMKGLMSDAERRAGRYALAILGIGQVEERIAVPFPAAAHRRLIVGEKRQATPRRYPRGPGVPAKRPLGEGAKQLQS